MNSFAHCMEEQETLPLILRPRVHPFCRVLASTEGKRTFVMVKVVEEMRHVGPGLMEPFYQRGSLLRIFLSIIG